MKELTQEQKAKAYDEALGKARAFSQRWQGIEATDSELALQELKEIFPELKESEDEMIRKAILELVKQSINILNPMNQKSMIAWLEKQGEQKPVISDDALREGIAHFGITQYQINNWLKKYVDVEKQGEQKETLCDKCKREQLSHSCQDITELGRCAVEHEQKPADEVGNYDHKKVLQTIINEQKIDNKVEPKFHEGDKLVSTKNPRLTYEVLEVGHINELGNSEYKVEIFTNGKAENPRNIRYMECYKVDKWAKLIEQKPIDKVEPKFKAGDFIADGRRVLLVLANKEERNLGETYSTYCEGLVLDVYGNVLVDGKDFSGFRLATDIEMANFVHDLKVGTKINYKPVWSEEDDRKRKGLIKGLEDRMGFGWACDPFSREEYIDWLKSIKDRIQPQPKQEWSKKEE